MLHNLLMIGNHAQMMRYVLHNYKRMNASNKRLFCTTSLIFLHNIAYNKQPCTNMFIIRYVPQLHTNECKPIATINCFALLG